MLYVFGCVALGITYASFFEWVLHRFVMHRPLRVPFIGTLEYAFKAHAKVHHHIFSFDDTYHLKYDEDKHTIPMAWWNWLVLVPISSIPFAIVSWISGLWSLTWIVASVIAVYYFAYEYIHWCMHLPRPEQQRLIEKSWIFYKLNGHHLLHHRWMHHNFNVVLPLADMCLGTLLLRSKIRFAQPRGPSVPNVQPTEKQPRVVGI